MGKTAQKVCTAKQERFLRLVLEGVKKYEAYKQAFNTSGGRGSNASSASRLLKRPYVAERLNELRAEVDAHTSAVIVPDIARRRQQCARWIEDTKLTPRERLQAMQELNRMTGAYAPQDQRVLVANAGGMEAGHRAQLVQALRRAEQLQEQRRQRRLEAGNPDDSANVTRFQGGSDGSNASQAVDVEADTVE